LWKTEEIFQGNSGYAFRVASYGVFSIVLVVVLVFVIEKAEYASKIGYGFEDEYKHEYESPAGLRGTGHYEFGSWNAEIWHQKGASEE
jgi:hypothetical protein